MERNFRHSVFEGRKTRNEATACLYHCPMGDNDFDNCQNAARYCRQVYEAGYSPICPILYLPCFLHLEIPREAKDRVDMAAELLRRSRILVVCGSKITQEVKNDIALAKHLRIAATTLEGILAVDGKDKAGREGM